MMQKILELDNRISKQLCVAETPGILRNLAVFFAHSGDSWFWLLGLGMLWLIGTEYWKVRAIAAGISILLLAIIVLAIKLTVKRRRPTGDWGEIYRKTDPHSFPSGHAARATLLAVLAIGLGPAGAGLVLAIWAPLVILARVIMGVHYLSDVIAGALIGIASGLCVLFILPLLGVPF